MSRLGASFEMAMILVLEGEMAESERCRQNYGKTGKPRLAFVSHIQKQIGL